MMEIKICTCLVFYFYDFRILRVKIIASQLGSIIESKKYN